MAALEQPLHRLTTDELSAPDDLDTHDRIMIAFAPSRKCLAVRTLDATGLEFGVS
jgi:hypothetical protein